MEKEYTNLIECASKELETANKALHKLEKKYKRSGMQNIELSDQIRNYNEKKANLKKTIKEYEAKLNKMKNFNDEIMPMLENLKKSIKDFVEGVASLKKAFEEVHIDLSKKIEELIKENKRLRTELAKRDEKRAKKTSQNKTIKLNTSLEILAKDSINTKTNSENKETSNKFDKQESKNSEESTSEKQTKNKMFNSKTIDTVSTKEVCLTKQNSVKIENKGYFWNINLLLNINLNQI